MLEHQDLTSRIIGGAIEVHKKLGPGFVESIYENALHPRAGIPVPEAGRSPAPVY